MIYQNGSRYILPLCLALFLLSNIAAQDEGAKDPQQLLNRIAEGVEKKDIPLLMSCLPPQANEAEKAAASASAKTLLLRPEVMDFGKAAKEKYGENFRKAIGGPASFIMVSMGAMDFAKLAKDAKIEVNESENTAIAKQGEGLGAMQLNLVRKENLWYAGFEPGLNPKSTELKYEASRGFLDACNKALKEAADQDDFSKQISDAVKLYQADMAKIPKE